MTTTSNPGDYNLGIIQGATCELTFTWNGPDGVPIDLTGYALVAKIVSGKGGAIIADLTPFFTLGGIAGTLHLLIPAAQTASFPRMGFWEMDLTAPDGTATRLLQGHYSLDERAFS